VIHNGQLPIVSGSAEQSNDAEDFKQCYFGHDQSRSLVWGANDVIAVRSGDKKTWKATQLNVRIGKQGDATAFFKSTLIKLTSPFYWLIKGINAARKKEQLLKYVLEDSIPNEYQINHTAVLIFVNGKKIIGKKGDLYVSPSGTVLFNSFSHC